MSGLRVKPLVVLRLLEFLSPSLSGLVKAQATESCFGDQKMEEGTGRYDLPSQGAGDSAGGSISGKRMEFHGSS